MRLDQVPRWLVHPIPAGMEPPEVYRPASQQDRRESAAQTAVPAQQSEADAVSERILQLVATDKTTIPKCALAKCAESHGTMAKPSISISNTHQQRIKEAPRQHAHFRVSRWLVHFSESDLLPPTTTMSAQRFSFPDNPSSRPQPVGRGHREPRVTEGLQNHMDQQKKNHEMAKKANETRRRNGTTTGQKSAVSSTPLASTTAQNRPPQTPFTTVPTEFHFPASHMTPSSIPCAPLPQILPQASSPFPQASSPFAGDQSLSPRSPPLLMPQNYQPLYPDFSQLSSSSYSTSQPLPLSEVSSMAQFTRMMETLRPDQLAQVNQMLGISITPGSGTDRDPDSQAGALANDYGAGQGDGARAGDGDDDDNDDDDRPAHDNTWNAPQRDNGDDEDIHQNAQSSLEFTMHDVNVERKRKRTRSVPQADGGSDSDNSPSTVRSQKRPRKKRAHRRQKSRSIREITGIRRSITEASYDFVQKRITIEMPFPAASETGDPSAADDEYQAVTEDSWDDAVKHLGLDPEEFQDIRMEESLLMRSRISQVRGYIMAVADKLVRTEYGFVDIYSLEDPTPEKIAEVREHNRDLVESLEGTFMFLNPKDTTDLATVGHHSIFQKLLNAVFFAKKGKNRRAHYFNDLEALPKQTFGLLMDATVCGIDRWKTGEHQMVPFEAEEYRPIHQEQCSLLRTGRRNSAGMCTP
ncbi:hypothetical protein B0H19DRAFT_239672 [Mycena capillaripes]|nr:hypothetical protein B0H19DRAFT_239672 [Mycena capillaripes]